MVVVVFKNKRDYLFKEEFLNFCIFGSELVVICIIRLFDHQKDKINRTKCMKYIYEKTKHMKNNFSILIIGFFLVHHVQKKYLILSYDLLSVIIFHFNYVYITYKTKLIHQS